MISMKGDRSGFEKQQDLELEGVSGLGVTEGTQLF